MSRPSLQRDMARLGFVVSQIREIEEAASETDWSRRLRPGHTPMGSAAGSVVGVGIETAEYARP